MKTLILFDVDGTLVYSIGRRDSLAFAATYESIYERPFPSIDWHLYPHVTDTVILRDVVARHFGRGMGPDEERIFHDAYVNRLQEQRQLEPQVFKEVPGAASLIKALLHRNDCMVAIATGGWKTGQKVKLLHGDIPAGQLPISAADGKENRRHILEEAVEKAQQLYGAFQRTVYIGDAAWDVVTTRELDMPLVGLRHRGDVEVLQREGVAEVLVDFSDQAAFWNAVQRAQPPTKI